MTDLTNPTSLPGGYKNGQQAPLDGKSYFQNDSDLSDVSNNRPFEWYKEMIGINRDSGEMFVWRESEEGLLNNPYRYPSDVISFGYDYSLKTFNWVPFNKAIGVDNENQFDNTNVKIINTPNGNVFFYNGYNEGTGNHEIKSIMQSNIPSKVERGAFVLYQDTNFPDNVFQSPIVTTDLDLVFLDGKIRIGASNIIRNIGTSSAEQIYQSYDGEKHLFKGIRGSGLTVESSSDDRDIIISSRRSVSYDRSIDITERTPRGVNDEVELDFSVNFPEREYVDFFAANIETNEGVNKEGELSFEDVGKQGQKFQPTLKIGTLKGSDVFNLSESNTENKFTTGLETKKFYNLYYPMEIKELDISPVTLENGSIIEAPQGSKNVLEISVLEKTDKTLSLNIFFKEGGCRTPSGTEKLSPCACPSP